MILPEDGGNARWRMSAEELSRESQGVEGYPVDIVNPKSLDTPFNERDDSLFREILMEVTADCSDCDLIGQVGRAHSGLLF
jgi:hypothetical protein